MNNLRSTRKEQGLNQRELAERSHTPQSTVSELERGVRKPWVGVVRRLSEALNTPIQQLFPDEWERMRD